MRLDKEIFLRGLCHSRKEAQDLILNNKVLLNNVLTNKPAKDVTNADIILITEKRKYVSRGGEKLEGALNHIKLKVENMTALDIGSSTGGFTDCLIQKGAKEVMAVDVGSEQFSPSLRNNSKIKLFENCDIRNFKTEAKFDLMVCDVSFISLALIFPEIKRLARKNTSVLLLIKPQFEVGRGNTKKGIVKDEGLYDVVIKNLGEKAKECDIEMLEIFPSSIVGGDGNREFFFFGKI